MFPPSVIAFAAYCLLITCTFQLRGVSSMDARRHEDSARQSSTSTMRIPPWLRPLERSIKQNKSERTSSWVQLATLRLDGRPAVRTVVHRGIFEDAWAGESPLLHFITDIRSEKVAQISSNHSCEVAWYFPITREQWRLSGSMSIVTQDGLVGYNGGWRPEDLERARSDAWRRLSDAARAQFVWPSPGQERAGPDSDFISALPMAIEHGAAVERAHDKASAAVTGVPISPTSGQGGQVPIEGAPGQAGAQAQVGEGQGAASVGHEGGKAGAQAPTPDAAQLAAAYSHFCLMLLRPDEADYLCLKYAPTQRRVRYRARAGEGGEGGAQEWTVQEVNP